jgi:site-specific recombinase XerD
MSDTRLYVRYPEEKALIRRRAARHELRHAFASRAHARGVTLQDLSMVMGHSSTAVTAKVYVHLYGREQAEERFRQAMAQAH